MQYSMGTVKFVTENFALWPIINILVLSSVYNLKQNNLSMDLFITIGPTAIKYFGGVGKQLESRDLCCHIKEP